MSGRFSRRVLLKNTGAALFGAALAPAILRAQSPASKLNIACIGVGGKGDGDSSDAGRENVVAICDVDDRNLGKKAEQFPHARKFTDYRKMLESMKEIDAVTISAPDHVHAIAAMMAIQLGKHVFVQKPLSHTLHEARALTEAARKYKVATQMGNQGHSGEGFRILCEYVWAGLLGEVREVHCWTDRPYWPQGIRRPGGSDPVPSHLHWDEWLAGAPARPYKNETYHTYKWRGWWDFGCGSLGDMGCHIFDGPVWALKLGHPTRVEVLKAEGRNEESAPAFTTLRYHFPGRENMPPVALTWHDGGQRNPPPRPAGLEPERKMPTSGTVLIGSKASMMCDEYGGGCRIFPESKMKEIPRPPQVLPRIGDHFGDWLRACKDPAKPASSNFDVSGLLTEIVLLGNVALRVGQTIEWDGPSLRVTNLPDANRFVRADYRPGWALAV